MPSKVKYALFGAAIGALFPIFAWALNIYGSGLAWSLSSIVWIHQNDHTNYFVDLAPFVLGFTFYYFSERIAPEQFAEAIGQRAELLLDAAAEGFYGINMEGDCVFANDACVTLLGYQSKSDFLGKNMHALIHHSYRDKTEYLNADCQIYKAFRNGLNVHVDDEVFWRADGTCFDAEYNANPLFENDTVTGAVISFSDISERKSREELARLAQITSLRLKQALHNISEAAALISLETGIQPFYAKVVKVIAETLAVERVGIWHYGDNDQSLVSACRFSLSQDRTRSGITICRSDFPAYFKIIGRKAAISSNMTHDLGAREIFEQYLTARGITAFMNAPIIIAGDAIGTLSVGHIDSPRTWDLQEEDFLRAVSLVVAAAMETGRRVTTEHREQKIVQTMIDGLITISEQGVVESFNASAEEIFGYKSREIIGQNLRILMDEPYREQHPSYLARYVRTGEARIIGKPGIEVVGLHKDGHHVPISISISQMTVNGRRIFSGIIRDISAKKALEGERQALLDDITQLIDSANAPIFGVNRNLQITEWNNFLAKMTGYEKREVANCLFVAEMIAEKSKEDVTRVLKNALSGIETTNFEATLLTHAGTEITVLLNAAARRDSFGKITGVIGVGQDITDLKEKERALHQAQKMEAVGLLTGGIAHDFNNLLSIIKGNLRFLEEDIGEITQGIQELFDDALSAVDDGTALTRRLLAFSRTSSEKSETIDVCRTIEDYLRFLTRAIGASQQLVLKTPDESTCIDADSAQLDNALLNLVINSRDAMPHGGTITITVDVVIFDDTDAKAPCPPGTYVRISVSDGGTGISPENLNRVFEPFFTTKSMEHGSGLGLSMIYGFVKQSGGTCLIESELEVGTTVSMIFPRSSSTPNNEQDNDDSSLPNRVSGAVILVVEDDPRVRRTVLRDFHNMGYRTIEAEDAEMAQKIIASEEPIDLVFTDILMPGKMDGMMLAKWIMAECSDMKVILTSGYSDIKTKIPAEDNLPMIRKPYSFDKLSEKVMDVLNS